MGESSARIPVVAHTVACFGVRPIANAFGIGVSAIATRGLGRFAWMQSRSISAWNSGASCGVTTCAPIESERDLVRCEELDQEQAGRDDRDQDRTRAGREQHADQDRVDEPQQEERQQHPGLKPGVSAEGCGACHR